MIYITGDTHGDYRRFEESMFPEQKNMTKKDYVLICGDFGIWNHSDDENYWLDWLDRRPFTTLFISGNHDNYDLLKEYEVDEFCGGKVQLIRPSILHLMRGQIFTIGGRRFFTMGGASCHDIQDGILSPDDPDYEEQKRAMRSKGGRYRIEHVSWWKEELPSAEEYAEAWDNLAKAGNNVDYIITHCPPESIRLLLEMLGPKGYPKDTLTEFLEQVKETVTYREWYFGHYHMDTTIIDNHFIVSERLVRLKGNEVL